MQTEISAHKAKMKKRREEQRSRRGAFINSTNDFHAVAAYCELQKAKTRKNGLGSKAAREASKQEIAE